MKIKCLGCDNSGWVFYCRGWTIPTRECPSECIEAEGECPFCQGAREVDSDDDPEGVFEQMLGDLRRIRQAQSLAEALAIQNEWENRAAGILEERWRNEQ